MSAETIATPPIPKAHRRSFGKWMRRNGWRHAVAWFAIACALGGLGGFLVVRDGIDAILALVFLPAFLDGVRIPRRGFGIHGLPPPRHNGPEGGDAGPELLQRLGTGLDGLDDGLGGLVDGPPGGLLLVDRRQ